MQSIIDQLFGSDVSTYTSSVDPLAIIFTILSVFALSLIILFTYKTMIKITSKNFYW